MNTGMNTKKKSARFQMTNGVFFPIPCGGTAIASHDGFGVDKNPWVPTGLQNNSNVFKMSNFMLQQCRALKSVFKYLLSDA